ncbi:hypothetical protein CRE_09863 [Caenorhabditis remanei]|uniref:F-box domain-containing protein n=1 Tax=Caenorhabditis remanei TaxID=31234 RepID=E3NKJ9_CAERE|nr:hypothetical protein CRE_09863 [Caenorhabditis remanei]
MNRPPPDSPIDLCALILYEIHQWKTAGTSYANYEKLCEAFGTEAAMSNEEYEYYFDECLKEAYISTKNGRFLIAGIHFSDKMYIYRDLPIPDIRGCILSDVINKKSAQKSLNDLCEAFESVKIDKEDHDYWFKRFENGDLFRQVTFSHLPEDVITEIVEKCDLVSFFQLRKVSHGLRIIVNHSKPELTRVVVECGGNHVSFKLDYDILVYFTDRKGVDFPKVYFKHLYKFEDDDYTKVAFNYLEILLKNPKLQLNYAQLVFFKNSHNQNNQMFLDLLNSLSHKIHVEQFLIHFLTDKDIITVVKCVKPGTLKSLWVFGYKDDGELSTIHELVETEQWRKPKFFSSGKLQYTSIEHFFHFDRFFVNIKSLSMGDVMNLTNVLSNSANFEHCMVTVVRYDQQAVKNALRLQYNHSSAPRLKSELYPNLVFRLSTSSIEIFKADFRNV